MLKFKDKIFKALGLPTKIVSLTMLIDFFPLKIGSENRPLSNKIRQWQNLSMAKSPHISMSTAAKEGSTNEYLEKISD